MKIRKTEIIISVIIMLTGGLLATSTSFTVARTSVCLVCGARQHRTRSLFGGTSEPIVEDSPFAQWLSQHGRSHVHRWQSLHSHSRNLFGRPISAGSAIPPPICSVQSALVERFLQSASESDIEAFEQLMLSGSDIEQEKFIRQNIRPLVEEEH